MKKILLPIILVSLSLSPSLFAQAGKEIKLDTNFFTGMKFFQGGESISATKAVDIMKSNSTASDLLRKSNRQAGGATIVSAIGGVLIGWQLGAAIAGDDPNWAVAGAGTAIIIVSAVIYSSAEKKAKNAVQLYNSGLTSSINRSHPTEVRLLARPDQIGFSISF